MTRLPEKGGRRMSLQHAATLRKITEKLGPQPRRSLSAMTDYGLSDAEIGRYYGLKSTSIARLRRALGVERPF